MGLQQATDIDARVGEATVYELQPQIGVMIAIQTYEKARSIKHCCQLACGRRMSVERKYDREC